MIDCRLCLMCDSIILLTSYSYISLCRPISSKTLIALICVSFEPSRVKEPRNNATTWDMHSALKSAFDGYVER